MSKALVITMRSGTAIKWAGKHHNHLATVSPVNGRILQMLPVRVRRVMKNGLDFFAVTRNGTEESIVEPFKSHREALEWIAVSGLFYVTQAASLDYGVVRKDFAEDLLRGASVVVEANQQHSIAA